MTTNFQEFVAKRTKKPDEDSRYMEIAIRAAEQAKANGDDPYGAVLVYPGGHMVEHDTCFSERDRTCHAEMNVLRKVARTKLRKLDDCVLYTTVEPCPMCAHAALLAGVREVVFGAYDDKNGFLTSDRLRSVAEGLAVKGGILGEQCLAVLPDIIKEHTRVEKQNV